MGAFYNGVDLGFIFEMVVAANPKGRQVNSYPGANGLEVLDHGSRGGTTIVIGAIVAPSAQALASAEQQLRSLQVDGGAYTLRDDLGKYWPGVILIQYRPQGRVYLTVNNYLTRRYDCEFLHVF
jgi:hypothetical protein